jgi:hypothetical protein
MGTRHIWPTLAVGAALLLVGCRANEDMVAEVAGTPLELVAFQDYLEATTGEAWQVVEERVACRLLDQFLDQEVIIAAAIERGTRSVPLEPPRRSQSVRQLLDTVCGEAPPLSEEAVASAVAQRLTQHRPAQAHVRQLLLGDLEQATAARQQLDAGEPWLAVSRAVSQAANAEGGGELGLVTQGTLPEAIDEVIFGLESGAISEPVPSPAGYHVFQVLEVVPAGRPAADQVRGTVRRELEKQHARQHVSQCVAELAREVGVVVYPDHLWFRYQGRYLEPLSG